MCQCTPVPHSRTISPSVGLPVMQPRHPISRTYYMTIPCHPRTSQHVSFKLHLSSDSTSTVTGTSTHCSITWHDNSKLHLYCGNPSLPCLPLLPPSLRLLLRPWPAVMNERLTATAEPVEGNGMVAHTGYAVWAVGVGLQSHGMME